MVAAIVRSGAAAHTEYIKTGVNVACGRYVGVGPNQESYTDFYDDKFVPRVLAPKQAEGVKKAEAKRDTLLLQATFSARGTVPAPQNAPILELGEGAPPSVIAPGALVIIERLAANELFDDQQEFDLMITYVSDDCEMKESILKVISDDDEGRSWRQKINYFKKEMELANSSVAIDKARWACTLRKDVLEHPKAFATKYKRAAKASGRTISDINLEFMTRLQAPWAKDPYLSEHMGRLEADFVNELQDNTALHIDAMAEAATLFETLAFTKVVNRLEHEQTLVLHDNDDDDDTASTKAGASSATDLPWKEVRPGMQVRACSNCADKDGVIVFHGPNNCPHNAGASAKAKLAKLAKQALRDRRQQQNAAKVMAAHRQQFVCFQCGQPGHSSKECDVKSQTPAGQKALAEWRRAKDAAGGSGSAMTANTADGAHQQEMLQLKHHLEAQGRQMAELMAMVDINGKRPASTSFMARASTEAAWLPAAPEEGGFCFNDSYSSSDEHGTGLLGSFVVKPGCGTPLGMVPASYVTTRSTRANPPCNTQPDAPPAVPVPQSARRQARMRLPEHDEARAMRNRLPAGMINPADLAPQVAPAAIPAAAQRSDNAEPLATRLAHLVHLLRTAFQHAEFGALPTGLVADNSPEAQAAWQRGHLAALAGMDHDGQDPRAIAWMTALRKAVNRFQAQASLTIRDYCQLDLRAVFREAILQTFGSDAAHIAMDPSSIGIDLPATPGLYGAEICSICSRVPLPPMRPAPVREAVSEPPAVEPPQLEPQPATVVVATAPDAVEKLRQHRAQRKAWRQTIRMANRRPVATVLGTMVPITVNGHQILGQIVLDLGANEPMIHQRVVDKYKWAVNPNGRSITGIHGESHMMAKTIEALEVTLFPEDCEREAQGCDIMMVMHGDSLPDLLLDNEMMAQLGIMVDPATWTASFLGRPYADAEQRTELPLMQPDRHAHIAA